MTRADACGLAELPLAEFSLLDGDLGRPFGCELVTGTFRCFVLIEQARASIVQGRANEAKLPHSAYVICNTRPEFGRA